MTNPHKHPVKSSYVVPVGKLKVYLSNGENIIADGRQFICIHLRKLRETSLGPLPAKS